METTVNIRIPAPLMQFGFNQAEIQRRVTEWMVLSLFSEGRISSGQGARLLQISRVAFLNLLRERGIAYINYTADELAEEFDAVQTLQL